MKNKYEYLRQIIKNNHISGSTTDEYMWTLWYVNCFYYAGAIGKNDINDHWTDERADGGIDYVYYNNNEKNIYLIQGKSESKLRIDDIKYHIKRMAETVDIFDQGKEDQCKLNKKIIKAFKKGMEGRTKENIKLVLITRTPITERLREQIDYWRNEIYKDYEVIVYGKDEIYAQEAKVSSGEKTVKKGCLKCADENVLNYTNGNNSGIIVNIKAYSLKNLFQTESDNGLFGYNLREYISKNKIHVDDEIKKTIKEDRDSFWFYNNGITIACKDYSIKNKELTLHDFSIINGAQTTTMIGKSPYIDKDKDFAIVCKIVKSSKSLDDNFVKHISIASNSQKEIEARDLFSNSEEQVQLQYRFMINEKPLAVRIKRGVVPANNAEVKDWERIENTKLGQIILSALLQKPGSARNKPKCIFDEFEVYKKIFNKKVVNSYNYNVLYDLVRLQDLYDKYKKSLISDKEKKKSAIKNPAKNYEKMIKLQNDIGVLSNSGYTVISIIAYLIKRKFYNLSRINSTRDEEWNKFVNMKINNDLLCDYNDKQLKKNINLLYDSILNKLFELYDNESKDPNSKVNNPSNYFKSDEIYRKKIIPAFDELLEKQPDHIMFNRLELFNYANKKS